MTRVLSGCLRAYGVYQTFCKYIRTRWNCVSVDAMIGNVLPFAGALTCVRGGRGGRLIACQSIFALMTSFRRLKGLKALYRDSIHHPRNQPIPTSPLSGTQKPSLIYKKRKREEKKKTIDHVDKFMIKATNPRLIIKTSNEGRGFERD